MQLFKLHKGPGDRRDDCRRYSDCLAGFVRRVGSGRRESEGHCPPGCRGFVPIPRHSQVELAHLGASSLLAEAIEFR